jgi:hypothetical protein
MRPQRGVGLEGGDEPVAAQGEDPGADQQQAAVLADALPDQPGAADLGQRGQGEQRDGRLAPTRMLQGSSGFVGEAARLMAAEHGGGWLS